MVVPSLSLPDAADESPVEQALGSDAVWLLSERAAGVVPGFTVGASNAGAVLGLCRRLDGIPLALELAAVRLAALSLDQLNQRLANELSILGQRKPWRRRPAADAGGDHRLELPAAQQQERLLWARLSVFAGGFEQDAATEVCSSPQLPAGQIVEVLGALVDKSVLKRQLRDSSPDRYWLLETLRQYGRQRLRELGEETVTQKRHLDWIRALAKTAGAWDGRQPEMFARMSSERGQPVGGS